MINFNKITVYDKNRQIQIKDSSIRNRKWMLEKEKLLTEKNLPTKTLNINYASSHYKCNLFHVSNYYLLHGHAICNYTVSLAHLFN